MLKYEMVQVLIETLYFHIETLKLQEEPSRGVLIERFSENMQQIYRRALMSKCEFN